ncbi:MAG: alanine racemase, partial [Gemmatimonadota bacterium]|nr:alanine racemase [Gemmatimonadota bacterium]
MSTASTALRSRAWVEVNLAALRANLREVQAAIGPGKALLPMVKADAYGLGMARVVEAVLTELGPAGPWGFGVAAVAEGERLRQIGWGGRILVLSPALPDEFRRAAHANLTLSFSGMDGVRAWAAAADEIGTRLPFHTEVDTGMGRAGFPCEEAGAWSPRVAEAAGGGLFWEGCFTHFHSADELDLAPTDAQWERFRAALSSFPPRREGDPPLLIHAANSAASLRRGGFRCDLARPGIFLYGGAAGPGSRPQPVVAVRARLSQVREVPSGATLGYGATYATSAAEIWGTAAIGYGDGLRRSLVPSGGGAIV